MELRYGISEAVTASISSSRRKTFAPVPAAHQHTGWSRALCRPRNPDFS